MKYILTYKSLLLIPFFSVFLIVLGQEDYPLASGIDNIQKKDYRTEKQITEANEWAEKKLQTLTLRQKIGQFFMVASYSNKGESHFRHIDSLIEKDEIGGLIFFQGDRSNLQSCILRFQNKSNVPLLIGMDAEWGVSMRLFAEERYPYNYTIGAANNIKLTERLSSMMGQECRELGIHLNFAPVADVNSNPKNPIIGFRSFGEYPKDVANHVAASVKGMEKQGIMTSIKHFPGHGDTEVDSHKELPLVNNTYKHINAIDFFPFRAGIEAGASTVMIGHLNVPALDPSGTPSSLSRLTIHDYLKKELGFTGLVVSDALGMKAVADRYGKTDVVVKAFTAGCDILLFPESVSEAIDALVKKVKKGEIPMDEIDSRCKKVLLAKYKAIVKPSKLKEYSTEEIRYAKKQLYEEAITVLKNENELLPIKRFDQRIAHVSIGSNETPMIDAMELVTNIEHFHFYSGDEALRSMSLELSQFDVIITTIHAERVSRRGDYGMPKGWRKWLEQLPDSKQNIFVLMGNPYVLDESIDLSNIESVVVAYENNDFVGDRVGQFILGTYASQGKLPITISQKYKRGHGILVKSGGRLKESQPEELGISRTKLGEIDSIAMRGIRAGAFPGCQIVVAVEGKVIYRKSFGNHTYDKNRIVKNDDIYDIASITKVAASTLSLMHYNSKEELNLTNKLNEFLPELTEGTPYASMQLRKMLSHQAGLKPWIPFYVKTMENNQPSSTVYAKDSSAKYNTRVAENLWIIKDYDKIIYDSILGTPLLRNRNYKYSDLGYYFIKKIIENKSNRSLDEFVTTTFYKPMGLNNLRYYPRRHFDLSRITPTENDLIFRKSLIHGYVHDQGAAMLGGVGGHAGLFSNALDLAKLMQMYLNNGAYGGVQYIKPQVIEEYTDCQYCPNNRRGAGFDKPTRDLVGGPTCNLVSLESYGHSGFTGTIVWADPVPQINYVFLSNRVYPDAENWKLVRMNIRTDIQEVIYQAVKSAK